MHRAVNWVVGGLLDLLLPPFCVLCGPLVPSSAVLPNLCHRCADSIEMIDPATQCVVCAGRREPGTDRCMPCRRRRPPWTRLTCAGEHIGVLRDAVHGLKYRHRVALAPALSALLVRQEEALSAPVDVVVPVPLTRRRRRERGFNQSELIAAGVARYHDAPVLIDALSRVGDETQVGAPRWRRKRLGEGAFRSGRATWGRRVLLVDDVVTTGATLSAATRALRRAGALSVRAAVVSRTREPER